MKPGKRYLRHWKCVTEGACGTLVSSCVAISSMSKHSILEGGSQDLKSKQFSAF